MHITMPQLGLGTFRLKDRQAIDAVAAGLELGYRHIDTAPIYGNEAEVGANGWSAPTSRHAGLIRAGVVQ